MREGRGDGRGGGVMGGEEKRGRGGEERRGEERRGMGKLAAMFKSTIHFHLHSNGCLFMCGAHFCMGAYNAML